MYVEWAPDATESSEWRSTADWVVGRINDLLRPAISGGLCQPLTMPHVVNAQYVIPTDLVRLTRRSVDLWCRVQTATSLIKLLVVVFQLAFAIGITFRPFWFR